MRLSINQFQTLIFLLAAVLASQAGVARPEPQPSASPDCSSAWRAETAEWSANPDPVAGDWGFDRQGYPAGLYLHGITMPKGRFPGSPLSNPVIYDNDVLCAMASLGSITLSAQIITPTDPKGVYKDIWEDSAYWHYDRYRNSKMDMYRIPRPLRGSTSG